MNPIKDKYTIGYRFGQKTFYSDHHLGLDLVCPSNTPVYAPTAGVVTNVIGKEGGNTAHLKASDGTFQRFMHLSRFGKTGQVSEGDIIGYVGSTGSLSTAPHLHWDLSKGTLKLNDFSNFIDPETYAKQTKAIPDMNQRLFVHPSGNIVLREGGKNYAVDSPRDLDILWESKGLNPSPLKEWLDQPVEENRIKWDNLLNPEVKEVEKIVTKEVPVEVIKEVPVKKVVTKNIPADISSLTVTELLKTIWLKLRGKK